MRLKSIKLAGFKSFVDPTTVNFPSNLGCVVGPNGCGKSNIIDAVRWVMGESSAKNLRGENMTDVIFNGSVNRKPIGQASIELVFDNTDGTLGGEYSRFAEIATKRRVTRDGQSDYFLNGTKCRRRDITDIFLGTGLGPRSYSIIEQGMISRLIESKPEELRVFIEEAAGISKYKERRRETENRMRRTMENLERLTDLRDEMERQLETLKRQAQAAERYAELKKEERVYTAQLQALQWKSLDSDVKEREQAIRDLEVKLEAVIAEQRAIDASIEKYRDAHTEAMDTFNEVQARFYTLGGEVTRLEQSIKHQQDRSRQLREDLQQTEQNYQQAQSHLQSDNQNMQRWAEELEQIEPELEMAQASEEETAETLQAAEEAMQQWQQQWDEFNLEASQPRQRAEVQQSRIQQFEQVLSRMQERVEKLEQEKQGLSAGPVEEEIELLAEQQAELDLQLEEQQQRIAEQAEQINQQRDSNNESSSALDVARNKLQSLRGRQASLEALQQAALGQQGGAINEWLSKNSLAGQARLAENIKVASGWETAVEAVLGEHLQAVCVDGLDAVAALTEQLQKGSVTLLDGASASQHSGSAVADTLASKVEGPQAASLLAGVYVAEDLPAALALRSKLEAHESVVTAEGLWLGPNWLRVAKDSDAQAGVLNRQQELETLNADIAGLEVKVEALEAEISTGREALKTAETLREQLQRELQDVNKKHTELRSELSAKQVQVEQISVRRDRINNELSESREQFQIEQEGLGEARIILQEAIEAMEQDANERERLLAVRDESRSKLDQARQSARHDKDSAHQLAMRYQSLRAQLDSMNQNIERTRAQVEQLEERRATLQEGIEGADEPIEELKMELEAQLESRLMVEEELSSERAKVDEFEHALRQAEQGRSAVEQRAQTVRSELESLRVNVQGLQVSRRALEEQLIATQFDLENVLANLPEEASESAWREELESIGRKIARLGNINMAAIDDYKSQSERKVYLDAQNDDLMEALQTLENAIAKIDKETRQRFKETFDTVNGSLQELFPKVFGGGTAYLEMTGDDLLDTGIAIMARPPGKRNSTIHLLSGGEKALTAIALVFSIFRLNPAPFCMLDEVDAPLDDANVGRYARLVKEMSKSVQFIYITHNKIAMEMAEQLLGVTMHEPGVSRLVTVDVDEAAELAAL
ncbi:chromosome segregation protein SMC [Dasania sp. GY-MA-18]|uniref:Chromosome partition protein Smc n=1 Tax=Dasania phycosphaerae TaxID=2950436 RepID=A0A9J6RIF6_9GAMM|nr:MULTISPECIES: chromosome segregation protein SMC [Dasania]MCR8921701.1 chromosome segregation protein SMC [Dasania sp. GY-MA-18]MCZ0864129.1 chromosome segregation protein SMC [Dasania phycosphaerae]MCZ0867857.1 chromosome segregation protein SMC [Dasania phycosphaerae]